MSAAPVTAIVCTRDRPEQLPGTLGRLSAQAGLAVLVVDQSTSPDPELARRAAAGEVKVLYDDGRGLSRARNLAVAAVTTPWVVFVDDDCHVGPAFAETLTAALADHPDAAFLAPHVEAPVDPAADGLQVTAFPVARERVHRGRWTDPSHIGFGACFAVRRDWVLRVGGWDERLGAGTRPFPAAEDLDFNRRLLRAGAIAVSTPSVRVVHTQWRSADELVAILEGYALATAGLCGKLVWTGDVAGGVWLWGRETLAGLRVLASGVRRRSRLRLRVGVARLRGHARGSVLGLRASW